MYRSMDDLQRYYRQSRDRLHRLDVVERDRNEEAVDFMRQHLRAVMASLRQIGILRSEGGVAVSAVGIGE